MSSRKRIGVVGVSGYGGGEILRLCALHPAVQVVYAAGESSAGQRLGSRYPGLGGALADLTIQAFDPRNLPDLDLLFLSLPTGDSHKAVANLPADMKVVDVGGDHRFVDGWTYGLTEVTGPAPIADTNRVADPGCFLATCYAHGRLSTQEALRAAREFYAEAAFVRVSESPPHSKWSQGTNLAFVSYASDPESETVIALGALDNLGKGAAGQAVQNMNLMLGCPEQLGLELVPMLP